MIKSVGKGINTITMAVNYIKVKSLGLQRLINWQHSIFNSLGREVMTAAR